MAEKLLNRVLVCIDGPEYDENGKLGHDNSSNIFRLKSLIATGTTYDEHNRGIVQTVRYYQAFSDGRSSLGRIATRSTASIDHQIKDITRDVCSKLESPQDEVFFFGFGKGAYIARAVASVLHYMGLPRSKLSFDDAFQKTLEVQKALALDDSLNGTKLLAQLKEIRMEPPIIRFVGLFDTIKPSLDKHQYDISFVPSIRNLRHALAFNETKLSPDVLENPASSTMKDRSFIQAWFMGDHQDMGGGTLNDGLSLYPLQWMLIDALRCGLRVQSDGKDKYLELAFPQFMGNAPKLGGGEKIEWRLRFTNDLWVTMFDVQSLHSDTSSDSNHAIRLSPGSRGFKTQRKVWNNLSKSLLGWSDSGAWGSIIHPSLYTILDRNPKMYDTGLFKLRKIELADFQERCMDGQGELQPWLEGLHLQASGVKAFRILVCGKTGVGKSTLINKVFGVEITEESTTYAQGVHDINVAFESPNHPGLLIHDSRGWQAGSDHELDLIAKFLRHRAFQKDPAESLHVIW
jgi:hypothetical protein